MITNYTSPLSCLLSISAEGACSNIEKDLAAGWGEVWVVAKNAKIRDRIQRDWEPSKADHAPVDVRFMLTTEPIISSNEDSGPERGD